MAGVSNPLVLKKLGILCTIGLLVNVPFGWYRIKYTEKFTWQWWVAIHASIPAMFYLRRRMALPKAAIPFSIAAAVCGQFLPALFTQREFPSHPPYNDVKLPPFGQS